jgi:hypothetical protein
MTACQRLARPQVAPLRRLPFGREPARSRRSSVRDHSRLAAAHNGVRTILHDGPVTAADRIFRAWVASSNEVELGVAEQRASRIGTRNPALQVSSSPKRASSTFTAGRSRRRSVDTKVRPKYRQPMPDQPRSTQRARVGLKRQSASGLAGRWTAPSADDR